MIYCAYIVRENSKNISEPQHNLESKLSFNSNSKNNDIVITIKTTTTTTTTIIIMMITEY